MLYLSLIDRYILTKWLELKVFGRYEISNDIPSIVFLDFQMCFLICVLLANKWKRLHQPFSQCPNLWWTEPRCHPSNRCNKSWMKCNATERLYRTWFGSMIFSFFLILCDYDCVALVSKNRIKTRPSQRHWPNLISYLLEAKADGLEQLLQKERKQHEATGTCAVNWTVGGSEPFRPQAALEEYSASMAKSIESMNHSRLEKRMNMEDDQDTSGWSKSPCNFYENDWLWESWEGLEWYKMMINLSRWSKNVIPNCARHRPERGAK